MLQAERKRRGPQRGQALLWFLAMTAACCMMLALVYNVGQVSGEKEKTVNAADAAALSGALTQARILNFEAYTNRAMIANEVTIAQLVSLDSWVRYDNTLMQNIALYTSWIPGLDYVTTLLARGTQIGQQIIDGATTVGLPALEVVNTILLNSREGANAVGVVAASAIASKVAQANQTTLGGRTDAAPELPGGFMVYATARNEIYWARFTQANTGNARGNAKAVILNSRDGFSTFRGAGKLIDAINTAASWLQYVFAPYPELVKTSGGTTLASYDHWAAQDSLDAEIHSFSCDWFDCGWSTDWVPLPLGYGRADATATNTPDPRLCLENPDTLNCRLARSNTKRYRWTGPIGVAAPSQRGIPNIRDLVDATATGNPGDATHCGALNGSDGPGLYFVAAVQKSGSATMTTQRIGTPGMNTAVVPGPQGSPDLKDALQNGDRLTSIAAACTFFLRPDWNPRDRTEGKLPRADHKHEYASLYNPYWQSRLTPVLPTDKGALYVAIGANPALTLVTP